MKNSWFKKIIFSAIVIAIVGSVLPIKTASGQVTDWSSSPGGTIEQFCPAGTGITFVRCINSLNIKSESLAQELQYSQNGGEGAREVRQIIKEIGVVNEAIRAIENRGDTDPWGLSGTVDPNEEVSARQEAARAAVTAAAAGAESLFEDCGINPFSTSNLSCWVRNFVRAIGELFKLIFGGILYLVGLLFDYSIKFSVTDFSSLVSGQNSLVDSAWQVLRDVANLFFIFILLYIAIGMILQLPGVDAKRTLVSVIVVALLINFSAFFTKIVIDASNVMANQFYQSIAGPNGNISSRFMNALPLGTSFKLNDIKTAGVGEATSEEGHTFMKTVVLAFGVVVMLLVAIFVFLTGAILFVVRTVTLIFLIILSPLAFLMYAFPNQKGYFDKWLKTLFDQAFFAPLYLLMVLITLRVLETGPLKNMLVSAQVNFIHLIFYYLIAIGLMFGSIIIAKSMGAKGASVAMKGAGALTGAAAGGVLWAGKQARRVAVASGVGLVGGGLAALGRGESVRKYAGTQLQNIKNDAADAWKQRGQSKIAKGVKEFINAPVKTTLTKTSDFLADQVEPFGVTSGFLGDTDKQRKEADKARKDAGKDAKDKKEADEKTELKKKEDRLRGNPSDAATIIASIKDKDIPAIASDVLVQHAQHLRASHLAESMKHLNQTDRTAIRNEIMAKVGSTPITPPTATGVNWTPPTIGTPGQKQAWDWLANNNAGKIF